MTKAEWYEALQTYEKPFKRWLRANYPNNDFSLDEYWFMFKNWFYVMRRADTRISQEEFNAGL